MIAVVQRVAEARVEVAGETVGAIGAGMLVLLGVLRGDGPEEVDRLARRIAEFRFFQDENGRMNLSAAQVGGGVLVVSQFTLAADGRRGRRPSFDRAAPPAEAEPLYERFVAAIRSAGLEVATGRFGAAMRIHLVADGPVTFALEERAEG